jgi:F-type H+-transporting ATPase subunit a
MSTDHNPLEQFTVKTICSLSAFGYDISFTNASLFMMCATLSIIAFFAVATSELRIVPGKMQLAAESLWNFVNNMVKENAGSTATVFTPLVFTLFIFILFANLYGMLPYGFTVTSHVIVTFVLAMLIFTVITITGFVKHGVRFFGLFFPSGTPIFLAPLIVVIEIFAYFSRPISLSLRLAGNMAAGHILLKVIAGFIVALSVFLKWMPIPLVVVLIGFEVLVALLQAYIFAILSCVYLNDALHLH